MKQLLLHVYAIVVAVFVLFVVVAGAVVTNSFAVGSPSAQAAASGLFSAASHQHEGEAAGLLVLVLAVWALIAGKNAPIRRFAWLSLGAVIAEIGLGHAAGKSSQMVGLLHAFLGPVLLATVVALALATSPGWRREPVMLQDKGWPPLRGLARTTLVFVVLQVALGAAFRHGQLGVMPHIIGALVVVILVLTKVICLTQMPGECVVKPASITLLVIVFVQVFLGLTVVSMSDRAMAQMAGLIFGTAHVALGAVILAATTVVALEARRSVRPQA